ncbi:hypothetical protein ACWGM0_10520 [Sphingomonas bisphenolicum]
MGVEFNTGELSWNPAAAELILPSTLGDHLEFLHVGVAGVDAFLRNWAKGKANARQIGSAVDGEGYVSLRSGANYLETSFTDVGDDITYLFVARETGPVDATTATRFVFGGNYGASTSTSFMAGSVTGPRMQATYSNNGGSTVTTVSGAALASGFACLIGTAAKTGLSSSNDDGPTIRNMTSGAVGVGAVNDGYVRTNPNKAVLIGSGYSSVYGGTGDVVLAMAWSRLLTSSERLDAYAWAKMLASTVDIAI